MRRESNASPLTLALSRGERGEQKETKGFPPLPLGEGRGEGENKCSSLWFPITVYVLLAFGLSAWLLQFNYFMTPDGVHYARMGENLIRGNGMGINPGEPYVDINPFYPLLIGVANLLIRDLELSGHLVSMAAFALTVIPLFLLVRRIYSPAAAHWTVILYLTFEFFLYYSNQVLTESLFTALVFLEAYLVHKALHSTARRPAQGILIGLVGGLAYLTRPEGFLFFLLGSLILFLSGPRLVQKRVPPFVLAWLIFLLLSAPFISFLYQNTGKFLLSGLAPKTILLQSLDLSHPGAWNDAKKIYEGLSVDKTKMKIDEMAAEFDPIEFLKANFLSFLRSGLFSVKYRFIELMQQLFNGLGFILIGLALFGAPWNPERRKSECLLFLFLLPLAGYFFLPSDPRHYHPFLVIFLMWMGNGVERIRTWAQESFGWSPARTLLLGIAGLLFFVGTSASRTQRTLRNISLPLSHRAMGLWMKENIPNISEEKVASRLATVNFYSGAKILRLPYVEEFDDFLKYLEHQRARYFVVGEDLGSPLMESYRFLLDETKPLPPNLSRKRVERGPPRMILYEIV